MKDKAMSTNFLNHLDELCSLFGGCFISVGVQAYFWQIFVCLSSKYKFSDKDLPKICLHYCGVRHTNTTVVSIPLL